MKPLMFFLSVIILSLNVNAQTPSCHGTGDFAMLAKYKSFRDEHAEPVKFNYSGEGEMISFDVTGGKQGKGFLIRAEKPTDNYLFVFHEWWGLNDYIKAQSAKFQKDLGNVNVLAIDLYDGKTTDKTEEAGKLMQAVDPKRAEAIIEGAINYVGKNAKIATVGWCFGGGWSLQATLLIGEQAVGCIMYYGMPEKDVEKLKTLNVDVLGIFAAQDNWITQDIVKQFDADMQAAGKRLDIVSFDAQHAFANPSNPQHDKEKTEKAYDYSIKFLKERL